MIGFINVLKDNSTQTLIDAQLYLYGQNITIANLVSTQVGAVLSCQLGGFLNVPNEADILSIPSMVSFSASTGIYYLAGGGLPGTIASCLVAPVVKPIVNKAKEYITQSFAEYHDALIDELGDSGVMPPRIL